MQTLGTKIPAFNGTFMHVVALKGGMVPSSLQTNLLANNVNQYRSLNKHNMQVVLLCNMFDSEHK